MLDFPKPVPGKAELNQIHKHVCFKVIVAQEFAHRKRLRAQEGLMILTRKCRGKVKGLDHLVLDLNSAN